MKTKHRSMRFKNPQDFVINRLSFGKIEIVITDWSSQTKTLRKVSIEMDFWWCRSIIRQVKNILQRFRGEINAVAKELNDA